MNVTAADQMHLLVVLLKYNPSLRGAETLKEFHSEIIYLCWCDAECFRP